MTLYDWIKSKLSRGKLAPSLASGHQIYSPMAYVDTLSRVLRDMEMAGITSVIMVTDEKGVPFSVLATCAPYQSLKPLLDWGTKQLSTYRVGPVQ